MPAPFYSFPRISTKREHPPSQKQIAQGLACKTVIVGHASAGKRQGGLHLRRNSGHCRKPLKLWQNWGKLPCVWRMAALSKPRLFCTCSIDIWQVEGSNAFCLSSFERITAMAAYETSRPAPFGAISIFRLVQVVSTTLAVIGTWNDARVTRKVLGKLSDRELDDIGLCRGDIEMIGR
jgi:uncharacterized protein YjiS (DUF1127 family)